jgi:hypothetical protein
MAITAEATIFASMNDRPSPRFHGRIPGRRPCAAEGCTEVGEFRAPGYRAAGFDGPGDYRWLCLDHVREFNTRYNYFSGMSAEEIYAAQSPMAGWERETRAFASNGADAPPRWSDFRDPMDALGARFVGVRREATARAAGGDPERAKALATLGLEASADLRAIRRAYSEKVRAYHPDRNGGDRRHEVALRQVIDAYNTLRK